MVFEELVELWDDEFEFFIYIGYGSLMQFVDENVFDIVDVEVFEGMVSLVFFLSCVVNWYEVLSFFLFGEVFVLEDDVGLLVSVVFLGFLFSQLLFDFGWYLFDCWLWCGLYLGVIFLQSFNVFEVEDICGLMLLYLVFGDLMVVVFEQGEGLGV